MVSEAMWKVWLRKKERLCDIERTIDDLQNALVELDAIGAFDGREVGGCDISKDRLESMLLMLIENLELRITEEETYLRNYED